MFLEVTKKQQNVFQCVHKVQVCIIFSMFSLVALLIKFSFWKYKKLNTIKKIKTEKLHNKMLFHKFSQGPLSLRDFIIIMLVHYSI